MHRAYLRVLWISITTSLTVSYRCDPSEPLFLTPYIANGMIEEAQSLARVEPFLPGVTTYAGYLTVNEKYRSHMFFWFCPKSCENWTTAPLIVWLQGGPGLSSMFAMFTENGPYVVKQDGTLDYRTFPWTRYFNVLYIDNPVGTGFSFTECADGYSTNQAQVGENLHEALRQFLLLFPQLQKSQLILCGQSYAGKYLTSLAYTILQRRETTCPEINVFGIFVGNPLISFDYMLPHYNEFLFANGLLDAETREVLREREEEILSLMLGERWPQATELFENTFFEGESSEPTLLYRLTGLPNHYTILVPKQSNSSPYPDFLKTAKVKKALHVGNYTFDSNNYLAKRALRLDLLKPYKSYFEYVLENYRVLVFTGQFDIICSYYLNEYLFNRLSWSRATAYHTNDRYRLSWGELLVGYYKQAGGFTHALIREAGHVAITDQPQWVLGLLRKFVVGTFDKYFRSLDVSYDSTDV